MTSYCHRFELAVKSPFKRIGQTVLSPSEKRFWSVRAAEPPTLSESQDLAASIELTEIVFPFTVPLMLTL